MMKKPPIFGGFSGFTGTRWRVFHPSWCYKFLKNWLIPLKFEIDPEVVYHPERTSVLSFLIFHASIFRGKLTDWLLSIRDPGVVLQIKHWGFTTFFFIASSRKLWAEFFFRIRIQKKSPCSFNVEHREGTIKKLSFYRCWFQKISYLIFGAPL